MSKRIFYASHAVGITETVDKDDTVTAVGTPIINGAQSVSINTNFSLEQIFQLGRLAVYDQYAGDPEVEVTISKALDGRELIWSKALTQNKLIDSANDRCTILLHIDEDTQDAIDNVPNTSVKMTGCYLSSINYTFPVDGNFIEELSFVGSNKETSNQGLNPPDEDPNTRVVRRQNFKISSGSVFPSGVAGKCITNVTISGDVGREKIFCLGQYSPTHRYANFPIEFTIAFDITPKGNSAVLGTDFTEGSVAECAEVAITKEPIKIVICDVAGNDAYTFDLGSGNSLQSVTYSGGDTGGGNVTETYTYVGYNELTIS